MTGLRQDVMEEIKAQVNGDWHDPHNGGTYSLVSESSMELDLERVTGNPAEGILGPFLPKLRRNLDWAPMLGNVTAGNIWPVSSALPPPTK